MIHSNIPSKHINLVQAYRKLEYICDSSLPFSLFFFYKVWFICWYNSKMHCINIFLIYSFWNMIHSNIPSKHINIVQAYRKLEYICDSSLPFSSLKNVWFICWYNSERHCTYLQITIINYLSSAIITYCLKILQIILIIRDWGLCVRKIDWYNNERWYNSAHYRWSLFYQYSFHLYFLKYDSQRHIKHIILVNAYR